MAVPSIVDGRRFFLEGDGIARRKIFVGAMHLRLNDFGEGGHIACSTISELLPDGFGPFMDDLVDGFDT